MEPSKRDLMEYLYGNYATGDYVYTIIIANTTAYYGGAEFPGVTEHNTIINPKVSNMIVSKYDSGDQFKYLIRHEFGHSFGNLDDNNELRAAKNGKLFCQPSLSTENIDKIPFVYILPIVF